MKIIASTFRSLGSTVRKMELEVMFCESVGIVLTSNDTDEVTCRIGVCGGEDERYDEKFIAEWGGKLQQHEATVFFPQHTDLIMTKWKYE